jgi:hypothetical protein
VGLHRSFGTRSERGTHRLGQLPSVEERPGVEAGVGELATEPRGLAHDGGATLDVAVSGPASVPLRPRQAHGHHEKDLVPACGRRLGCDEGVVGALGRRQRGPAGRG